MSRASAALAEVAAAGLPNYFDDQRFGSVGEPPRVHRAGAGARPVRGGAAAGARRPLRVRPGRREAREGSSSASTGATGRRCKAKLPHGHARSLVDYLVHHPTDFKGAVARLRPELQGLYLSAYQSHLWNRMLAAWLTRTLAPDDLAAVELKLGRVPVPVRVPDGAARGVGVARRCRCRRPG